MTLSLKNESKLLARHSLIYGLGELLSRVVALLLLPIYTRFLTPYDYGIKELVGLSTDVIGILLATSISSSIYRFYFDYEAEQDRNEVISSSIITIGVVGLIAISILAFTTKTMAFYILDSSDLYYFFLISFASLWFTTLNQIGYNYLRAHQQSIKFIILAVFKLLITISLNIYLICFLKMGVVGILISTLITSIIMSFVLMVPIIMKVKLRFSKNKIIEILKYGLPLIPAQLGAFIVHLSDRFFIKGYCSIADAGIYSLGYRFGALPSNFISGPFNQTWQPRRFELYKQEGSEKVFGKIFTYFLYLMFFAGLIVSVLTKEILMLMSDPQFWEAYQIVPIIVLATTIFTFHYHLNMGILIHKKTKYLAYINFSNGIIILILNFLLIPPYGIWGAAYATLLAFIYKIVLTYYISNKYHKIYFEVVRISKILFTVAVLYCFSYFMVYESIFVSLVMKSIVIMLYPFVLSALRFYEDEEKETIVRMINKYVLRK